MTTATTTGTLLAGPAVGPVQHAQERFTASRYVLLAALVSKEILGTSYEKQIASRKAEITLSVYTDPAYSNDTVRRAQATIQINTDAVLQNLEESLKEVTLELVRAQAQHDIDRHALRSYTVIVQWEDSLSPSL